MPWEIHWHREGTARHHLWWLIAMIVLLAIFMVGVGVTSGLI
jgi:hypothetical protein